MRPSTVSILLGLAIGLATGAAVSAGAQQPTGAHQSTGARGIAAARRGGVVIACRHGITDSANESEMTLRYDDATTQRRLSAAGERQVREMGDAFRALGIPIGEVVASPMQRARRMAELMFGRVELDSAWHTRGENYDGPKRERRVDLLSRPVEGGNRVVISHIGTMYSVLPSIRGQLEEGDCAVIRPLGEGAYDVVDVVPWRAWLRAGPDDGRPPTRRSAR